METRSRPQLWPWVTDASGREQHIPSANGASMSEQTPTNPWDDDVDWATGKKACARNGRLGMMKMMSARSVTDKQNFVGPEIKQSHTADTTKAEGA
jgi:hypothetical protein